MCGFRPCVAGQKPRGAAKPARVRANDHSRPRANHSSSNVGHYIVGTKLLDFANPEASLSGIFTDIFL